MKVVMAVRRYILFVVIAVVSAACTGVSEETTSTTKPSSTTITITTTTTSIPTTTSTTTSTTTTTTVPPAPECVDSFYWRGEVEADAGEDSIPKGHPAQIGPLTEPVVDEVNRVRRVGVAVCLIEIVRVDTVLLGEAVPTWHLVFSFGENKTTGEEIIGDLFLGPDDWNVARFFLSGKGFVVPFDPGATSLESSPRGGVLTAKEFVNELEVGRLYPIKLEVENLGSGDVDCSQARDEWRCELVETQLKVDQLAYNAQLYEAMRGSGVTPNEGFGYISVLFLVSIWPPS